MDLVTIKTYTEEYLVNALGGFQLQCKPDDTKQALEIINKPV